MSYVGYYIAPPIPLIHSIVQSSKSHNTMNSQHLDSSSSKPQHNFRKYIFLFAKYAIGRIGRIGRAISGEYI